MKAKREPGARSFYGFLQSPLVLRLLCWKERSIKVQRRGGGELGYHHVEGEKVEGPVISEHDAASRPGAVVVHSQIAVTALLAVVGSHGLEAVIAKLAGFFIRLNWVQPDHIFLDDGLSYESAIMHQGKIARGLRSQAETSAD